MRSKSGGVNTSNPPSPPLTGNTKMRLQIVQKSQKYISAKWYCCLLWSDCDITKHGVANIYGVTFVNLWYSLTLYGIGGKMYRYI